MKIIPLRMLLIFVALNASVYAQLTVNLPGENGITFSGWQKHTATPEPHEIDFDVLQNATTFNLNVSTPDDILVVDFTLDVSQGSVYHDNHTRTPYGHLLARNTGPPPLAAIRFIPQLAANSWVTTPGSGTTCDEINGACPGFENVGQVSHFDSSGEGAQTDFHFARITMVPDETGRFAAEFSGVVSVAPIEDQFANQAQPITSAFSFTLQSTIPEPDSMSLLLTALFGGLAMARNGRSRRR